MDAYKTVRPFFIQRLLQMQIAFTYFYTALYKVTAQGNWLNGNPLFCLMNYPPEGVTKYFILRDFLVVHPDLCYWLGVTVLVFEFLIPVLLFVPKTRITAIMLGFVFHVVLLLTLDVPAIFFFLFPAQLLLFIDPVKVIKWIESRQEYYSSARRLKIFYDGKCQFCRMNINMLKIMDLFGKLDFVNIHNGVDFSVIHPKLTLVKAMSQMYVIDHKGNIWGGFLAIRRIAWELPMLYPALIIFYLPCMKELAGWAYRLIANNRYLLHNNKICSNNSCFREH